MKMRSKESKEREAGNRDNENTWVNRISVNRGRGTYFKDGGGATERKRN